MTESAPGPGDPGAPPHPGRAPGPHVGVHAGAGRHRRASFLERARGPWRILVSEASMLPAVAPGDWLCVDPTVRRWPRRGSLVVFRDPAGGDLAIKRVAGRPGDMVPFADGYLRLAEDEAWLLSDATEKAAADAGFGPPVDSRRYGPVPVDLLVGRAWFRYGPAGRIGLIR